MKRALREHRVDFGAIAALVLAAIAVTAYILNHQPSFQFGQSYYTVKAEFATAAAVTQGQGQAVTIAGVQVGQIGGVSLQDGRAVVTMNIFKQYAPIYRDATVLLRPRTPLKDMYLALDPGSQSAGVLPQGGTLGLASTQPDIDVDQILDSLDADTRTYLLLLLSGGAQAFNGKGATADTPSASTSATLAADFKRFAPLNKSALNFTKLLSKRSTNLRRAIHNLNLVATALGGVDTQLASLVKASNTNFSAIAAQDQALSQGISLLPGALQQTSSTLGKVKRFASASGPALQQLVPFAKDLGPALSALRPLAKQTTPVIEHQLAPFASNPGIRQLVSTLAPAAGALAKSAPALTSSFSVLNKLFNTLAYHQKGSNQSYLYWGSWLAHNLDSVTSLQDADGPLIQGLFMASCPSLNLLEVALQPGTPSLTPILDMLNAPDWSKITNCYGR
jgi:phospholipid/cholesterol/gamma-HCH transport system substrate-binding protein